MGFTLVPGTVQEDGTINRTVASSPSGSSLTQAGMGGPAGISSQSKKEEAWEFSSGLQDGHQVRFGLELESLIGAAARYPTSNLEAFEQLPWTVESGRSSVSSGIDRRDFGGPWQLLLQQDVRWAFPCSRLSRSL